MPAQQLPSNPSVENLRKQAKSLRRAVLANDRDTLARVREFRPKGQDAGKGFQLSDAQFVIARIYGFSSWSKLKQYVEVVEGHTFMPPHPKSVSDTESFSNRFIRLACLDYLADHVERREQAREMFAQNPSLAFENIFAGSTVGDVQAVTRMLEQKPELARTRGGPHNWEPLLYVAYSRLNSTRPEHSTLEVARLLLKHGADPNAGFLWDGQYTFTALTGAFGEGEAGPKHQSEHQYCYQLARLLLEAGADPNDSQTLYNRMFTGGIRHLELLFEYGLGKGGDGIWFQRLGDKMGTPREMLQQQMGWAAKYNQFERMKLLVEHGVDVNAADSRLQKTPYELAVLHGNKEIADYLLQHGAEKTLLSDLDDFATACLAADEPRARLLLDRKPDLINELGLRRAELLQLAAESDKSDAMRLMVKLGFDVNARCRTTALHHAAMGGHLEMAKLLIDLGADPSIRDTEFNAHPSGWAEYSEKTEVAEYLRSVEEDR
jgi:ankyrin repeat protein